MKIPRLTLLTLGVADLDKATQFYKAVLGTPPNRSYEGVTFIELPGTWLALYPPLTCGKRAWGASYTTLRQAVENPDPGLRSPPTKGRTDPQSPCPERVSRFQQTEFTNKTRL